MRVDVAVAIINYRMRLLPAASIGSLCATIYDKHRHATISYLFLYLEIIFVQAKAPVLVRFNHLLGQLRAARAAFSCTKKVSTGIAHGANVAGQCLASKSTRPKGSLQSYLAIFQSHASRLWPHREPANKKKLVTRLLSIIFQMLLRKKMEIAMQQFSHSLGAASMCPSRIDSRWIDFTDIIACSNGDASAWGLCS